MNQNRLKVLGLVTATLFAGGCFPAPYSYELTGTVVDDSGKPVQDASVVSVVYKSCGSVGGKSSQRLKSSIVKTGADGRYHDRISGVSMFHFEGIAACLGYEHHTMACKAGFKPSTPARDGGAQVLRLSPGIGWSYLELPPECAAAKVIAEAQAHLTDAQQLPPPTTGTVEAKLWDEVGAVSAKYADPSQGETPSVSVETNISGEHYWLVVREQITGGRPYREAHIYRGQGFATSTGFNSIDINTTYVFLLKRSAPNVPLFDKARAIQRSTQTLHLEPAGGVRWTVTASGPRRTGERIKPVAITKDDWLPLRESIAGMNAIAAAKDIALHTPKELRWEGSNISAPSETKFPIQVTGRRMTMPLWAKREWMYPTVLDRGGAAAPYPAMPVVTIEGPQYRLISIEHVSDNGVRDVEISIVSGEFFFTKNYGASDGRYRTCIFELGKPEPTAKPVDGSATSGAQFANLQPRGGIAWDLAVGKGARKDGNLKLESATQEDWKHLGADMVSFSRRGENKTIHLFDPAPPAVKETLQSWIPGLEVFPEIYDPGSPGMPLIKIPFYHRMGWGWITVEEFNAGSEAAVHVSISRESDYVYERKADFADGSLTVYVFPTWLARPGSKPLVEFPDKPVQFNEGGMVFSRAESFEPMGALKWRIDFHDGVRASNSLKISTVGTEAWYKFRPQIVKLNQDLNAVKYQQYMKVIFDPTSVGPNGAR